MKNELSIAFTGHGESGGAPARRASGQARKVCAADERRVIDINQDTAGAWLARLQARAGARGGALARSHARRFAAQARNIRAGVACVRQWLQDDTLARGGAALAAGSGT